MGIFGFLLMGVLCVIGLSTSQNLSYVVDMPSVLIVIGALVGTLLMSYGTGVGTAVRVVFNDRADRNGLMFGIAVFERGKSYAAVSGVLGTMVGMVNILSALDDLTSLGPGVATALITWVYGVFLAYGVFQPIVTSLRRRLDEVVV